MEHLIKDVKHAIVALGRDKAFAAAALLTLGLGIGATTAVFSVVYGVLLRPLPYPDSGRLVRLSEERPGAPRMPGEPPLTNTTMYAWRARSATLEGLAAYYGREYTVILGGEAARVHGAEVSPDAFGLLRATPEVGRLLRAGDETPNANGFVVIADRFWRERFGRRADIVGQAIDIDGRAHQIVGVARPDFHFPDSDAEIWTPYDDPTIANPATQGGVWLAPTLGRLKPGATIEQARAEGTAVARGVKRPGVIDVLFGAGGPMTVRVETLAGRMTAGVRPILLVLAAGVAFVLLLVCANVANLALARGVARQRELALRAAIGASAARLARQLLTESAVLSAAGGALGLAIGWALLRAAPALMPSDFPRLDALAFDRTVVAVAAAASMLTVLLSGLVPALRGARFDLAGSLHGGDGATAGGFRGARARRLRDGLLVAESAVATLLVVGAALVGRSFVQLTRVDAGYEPANVLTARVYPPAGAPAARRAAFVDALVDRLRADGRVVAAGAGNMMPFSDSTYLTAFALPETLARGKSARARTIIYSVTPGYAEALGLRLREGRLLTRADAAAGRVTLVVNEEFARQYLPAGPVAGRSFAGGPFGPTGSSEIVGLVGNVLKDGNDDRVRPEIYALTGAAHPLDDEVDVVVRATGDPGALASTVREAVRALDPRAAVGEVTPLERRVSSSFAEPRFATGVLASFALLALTLAAVGLYGVLSYTVSERRRELGVRAALGAERRDLLRLVLGEGLTMTLAGLAAGAVAAAGLTRLMTGLLFGVTPLDPIAYVAAPALLVPVAAAGCLLPALRAARTNPADVLKGE